MEDKRYFFMPRYMSCEPIKRRGFHRYRLDLSKADRDVDSCVYLHAFERWLNKSLWKSNYHAIDNGVDVFSEKPISEEHCMYSYEYNSSPTTLSLIKVEDGEVDLSEKKVYEDYISLLIQRNLMRQGKYSVLSDHKIICSAIPNKYETEMVSALRQFEYQIHLDDNNFFHLFLSEKTALESKQTLLDLYRRGENIYGLKVKYKMAHISKPFTGYIAEGFSDHIKPEFRTRDGLIRYYHSKYNKTILSPEDDFAVELKRNNMTPSSFLASMLCPVMTLENLSHFDSTRMKQLRAVMVIDIERRMHESTSFVSDIGTLPELNNACFRINTKNQRAIPQQTTVYGLTPYKMEEPMLRIGNNVQIPCDRKSKTRLFAKGNKFYHIPYSFSKDNPLRIALVAASSKIITDNNQFSEGLIRLADKICSFGLYNSIPKDAVVFKTFHRKSENYYSELDFVESIAKDFSPQLALVIVDDRKAIQSLDDGEEVYPQLKEAFADNRYKIPSQMISRSTATRIYKDNKDAVWFAHNVIMGLLGKLGGIPFVFANNNEAVDLFVGIDVGMQEKSIHLPACATAFMGEGRFIGVFTPSHAIKGEKIPPEVLKSIFDRIISVYHERVGNYPKRVVIHRDGFSREDDAWYRQYFEKCAIMYRIVEVKKRVFDRIDEVWVEPRLTHRNPDAGWSFLDHEKNEALLITSEPMAGSVSPLKICLQDGTLPLSLEEASQQVYNLTKINAASCHNTRLPITIRYADALSKHPSFVPSGEVLSQLFFI